MARNRISEACVELKVKGEKALQASLGRINDSLKGIARNFDSSLGKIGDKLDRQTEGARKFQGAIGGILGIVVALVIPFVRAGQAIYKLGDAFAIFETKSRNATRRAQEFLDTLDDQGIVDTESRVKAIREEIERLNAIAASEGLLSTDIRIFEGGREGAQRLADELQNRVLPLTERLAAEQRRINKQAAEAMAAQLSASASIAEAALLREQAANLTNETAAAELLILAENIEYQEELIRLAKVRSEAEATGNAEAIAAAEKIADLAAKANAERIRGIELAAEAARKAAKERAETERQLDEERARRERERIEEERRAREQLARDTAAANAAAIDQLAQRQADAIASVIDANSQQFARLTDLMAVAVDRLETIRRNTKQ